MITKPATAISKKALNPPVRTELNLYMESEEFDLQPNHSLRENPIPKNLCKETKKKVFSSSVDIAVWFVIIHLGFII